MRSPCSPPASRTKSATPEFAPHPFAIDGAQARKLTGSERRRTCRNRSTIARAEINRLDSIVTQFLRAIRPSQPQLQPENINTIVEEAVRFFAPEIKDRDIVVEQELRSDLPLLQLDRDQMKQAFYNVIKNSFEAMKRRGILRIRTDMDETHVLVSFTDTGGGMSAENLSRVFEPYFTTKATGTGLGLLIVRRIVREHGGELSIESNEGKGLTLTIRLPFSINASACWKRALRGAEEIAETASRPDNARTLIPIERLTQLSRE